MGTDMSMRVYGRKNEEWEDITTVANWASQELSKMYETGDCYSEEGRERLFDLWAVEPTGRSYEVFSVLSNVRNGHGFAGIQSYKPLKTFEPDSDWNEDEQAIEMSEDFDGWYGFTVLSLQRLLKRKDLWGQPIHHSGYCKVSDWVEYLESQDTDNPMSTPSSWCLDLNDSAKVPLTEFATAMQNGDTDKIADKFVRVHFTEHDGLKHSSFYRWLTSDRLNEIISDFGSENLKIIVAYDC